MLEPTVRPARDGSRATQHDHAGRPPAAEACDHPQAADLEQPEHPQPEPNDGLAMAEYPQAEQPRGMQPDHQWIMRSTEFDTALCTQSSGVEMRQSKLEDSLHDQERNQPSALTHEPPQARESSQ
jgi:hypothetical protein